MTSAIDSPSVIEMRKRLGHQLRLARRTRRMSQADLASATRTNQTTISQYERAVTRPSLDTVVALEEALGLRRGSLLVAAGYVEVGAPVTVEDAIRADPGLDDVAREYLLALLARARAQRSCSSPDAA